MALGCALVHLFLVIAYERIYLSALVATYLGPRAERTRGCYT